MPEDSDQERGASKESDLGRPGQDLESRLQVSPLISASTAGTEYRRSIRTFPGSRSETAGC